MRDPFPDAPHPDDPEYETWVADNRHSPFLRAVFWVLVPPAAAVVGVVDAIRRWRRRE